jgi:hypothetical protein
MGDRDGTNEAGMDKINKTPKNIFNTMFVDNKLDLNKFFKYGNSNQVFNMSAS